MLKTFVLTNPLYTLLESSHMWNSLRGTMVGVRLSNYFLLATWPPATIFCPEKRFSTMLYVNDKQFISHYYALLYWDIFPCYFNCSSSELGMSCVHHQTHTRAYHTMPYPARWNRHPAGHQVPIALEVKTMTMLSLDEVGSKRKRHTNSCYHQAWDSVCFDFSTWTSSQNHQHRPV